MQKASQSIFDFLNCLSDSTLEIIKNNINPKIIEGKTYLRLRPYGKILKLSA